MKNDIVNLKIIDVDYEGQGIAKYNGKTVIVKNAILDEEVEAIILKENKNIIFAKTKKVLVPSKYRITPPCEYYNLCGGCNMMHIDYKHQLELKRKIVETTLSKMIGKCDVEEVVENGFIYEYRNKVSVPIGFKDNGFIKGFYREHSHDIIPSKKCLIEPVYVTKLLNEVVGLLNETNIKCYDELNHTGDIRHILVRTNHLGEMMIVFVSRTNIKDSILSVLSKLKSEYVSAYLNIQDKKTNVILGSEFIHLDKEEYLIEELNGLKFKVHPNSFMQVNYNQMIKLYNEAISKANIKSCDVVIDAYSGIGTIGMCVSKVAKKVYGIETVKEAVLNARENAVLNNVDNIEFILGKCEDEIRSLVSKTSVDVLIMDPPRKGSDEVFLQTIVDTKIKRVVYISCNPASLARDLKYLLDRNYKINNITPVDLFSHSSHIETVVSLELV